MSSEGQQLPDPLHPLPGTRFLSDEQKEELLKLAGAGAWFLFLFLFLFFLFCFFFFPLK